MMCVADPLLSSRASRGVNFRSSSASQTGRIRMLQFVLEENGINTQSIHYQRSAVPAVPDTSRTPQPPASQAPPVRHPENTTTDTNPYEDGGMYL